MTASEPNDLGAVLRSWRGRRGVSQLEPAVTAGTTQRHLSFIESGRSVPGRGMVLRLAEALEVPLRERNTLLLAAGYAPAYALTSLEDQALGAVRAALGRILEGHLPYPAVITDRLGELVSGNRAFWTLAAGAATELTAAPVSVPRLLLHPEGLAPRILNLDLWGWHVIAALRRQTLQSPSEPLEALIAELEELLPERSRAPTPDYVGLAVPLRLRLANDELHLLTTLTHFGTAVDVALAELRLEAFPPADESTASALFDLDVAAGARGAEPTSP